jgi:hypothetical protein
MLCAHDGADFYHRDVPENKSVLVERIFWMHVYGKERRLYLNSLMN